MRRCQSLQVVIDNWKSMLWTDGKVTLVSGISESCCNNFDFTTLDYNIPNGTQKLCTWNFATEMTYEKSRRNQSKIYEVGNQTFECNWRKNCWGPTESHLSCTEQMQSSFNTLETLVILTILCGKILYVTRIMKVRFWTIPGYGKRH